MTIPRDPLVAHALDRLVGGVESDPEEMLARARMAAASARQRHAARLRRGLLLAFAALALLAGAAFAASRFDALPWFNQSDRSSATYVVDSSRRYDGPAPEALNCPGAGAGAFTCSLAPLQLPPSGRRTYMLAERVEAQPHVSRQHFLDAVATSERKGQISRAEAEQVRRDIAGSGDDFFSALALMTGITTIGGGEQVPGRPGYELVPPRGVPMWIACEQVGPRFRCHDLASARNVAIGTPLYMLATSRDWVAVPRHVKSPPNVSGFFRAVLHRDLRPAEVSLMIDLMTLGRSSSSTGEVRPERVPRR
jgi:hypothetical protein